MTKIQWDVVNVAAEQAGFDLVFGLNTFNGWNDTANHSWDSSGAKDLIGYTMAQKYPVVGWELGNEPDLDNKNGAHMNATILAAHFKQLFTLLAELYPAGTGGGTSTSPFSLLTSNGFMSPFGSIACDLWPISDR